MGTDQVFAHRIVVSGSEQRSWELSVSRDGVLSATGFGPQEPISLVGATAVRLITSAQHSQLTLGGRRARFRIALGPVAPDGLLPTETIEVLDASGRARRVSFHQPMSKDERARFESAIRPFLAPFATVRSEVEFAGAPSTPGAGGATGRNQTSRRVMFGVLGVMAGMALTLVTAKADTWIPDFGRHPMYAIPVLAILGGLWFLRQRRQAP